MCHVPEFHKQRATAMVPPLPVDQLAFSDYPRDDEDSLDELDDAAICNFAEMTTMMLVHLTTAGRHLY
jgi:hypothetical protein